MGYINKIIHVTNRNPEISNRALQQLHLKELENEAKLNMRKNLLRKFRRIHYLKHKREEMHNNFPGLLDAQLELEFNKDENVKAIMIELEEITKKMDKIGKGEAMLNLSTQQIYDEFEASAKVECLICEQHKFEAISEETNK